MTELQDKALKLIKARPRSRDELAEALGITNAFCRECITWPLIDRRLVDFTRDWKLKAVEFEK